MCESLCCLSRTQLSVLQCSLAWPLCGLVTLLFAGCGQYPEPIRSSRDIKNASTATEMLTIRRLPIGDYPALARFTQVRRIDFYDPSGMGTDDERLKVLAGLRFPCLNDVSLLNCPLVTDAGILSLCRIKSIKTLQLEGTSITDASIEAITAALPLRGLDVANCRGVTFDGLLHIADAHTLEDISFSVENLNQGQVLDLLRRFKFVKRCEVIDPEGKLDAGTVEHAVPDTQMKILVARKGALQTMASIE